METYFSVNRYFGVEEEPGRILSVPVQVGVDTIADELEAFLCTIGPRRFLSNRMVAAADVIIGLLTDKLEVYHAAFPEEASAAGERMIGVLEDFDTDDDVFPAYQIEVIREILGSESSNRRPTGHSDFWKACDPESRRHAVNEYSCTGIQNFIR